MKRPRPPAAAEALADNLLRSIRPLVVQVIADALAKELPALKDVELTEEDYEQATQIVAGWGRSGRKKKAEKKAV